MRVALYCRVSTADQYQHGLSIEAQLAALRAWAESNGHEILGEYIDGGISGKTPIKKRPSLSRFVSDLENGMDVDAIAFVKLDRFFRSVKLYYEAVSILDKYKCAWIATQEDYETVTSSGRFKVNIMLSVGESEADRTSERIKAVFQHKVDMGQALNLNQPFGYTVKGKKVVPDENADAAIEMFEYFAATGNTYATRDMLQKKYGITLNYKSVANFLKNPMYVGRYRDNPNYCEPLISQELFDSVQADFAERRKTKRAPSGRVYLFSGLIVCGECGHKLNAAYCKRSTIQPVRYRCTVHQIQKTCSNSKHVSEVYVERELLRIVSLCVAGLEGEYQVAERKIAVNKSDVQQKLIRLKELYIEGDISKEEYVAQRDKLSAMLDSAKAKQPNSIKVLGDNFLSDYATLTQEEKRELWHEIIDHIVSDRDGNLTVYFLP